jgi:hypothetical protein
MLLSSDTPFNQFLAINFILDGMNGYVFELALLPFSSTKQYNVGGAKKTFTSLPLLSMDTGTGTRT